MARTHRVKLALISFALFVALILPAQGVAQTCCSVRGNVDCDPDGNVDIADLTRLVDFMYVSFTPLCCDSAANIDADPDGFIDISDLIALVDYMYIHFIPPPPCSNGNLMDPAVRLAAIDMVAAKAKTLDWGNLNAANDQLAAYMNTLPEFDTAAVNSEVANVWALFTDSVLFMFVNNRGPSAVSAAGAPAPGDDAQADQSFVPVNPRQKPSSSSAGSRAAGEELPLSVQARLIETLGSHFAPATSTIRTMLTANGYLTATPTSGTVGGLKLVGGDGVLYYDGHGGAGYFNTAMTDSAYGLWTSTEVTQANLPSYSADFTARRLCLMCQTVDIIGTDTLRELHYGITPKFVTWYWHDFGQNAMVFIDACGGGGAFAAPFRNAIIAKKASVYFGWTKPVYSDAASLVAKFMFDRLMGANVAAPKESPPQRPFSYVDVYGDLANRGLTVHPSTDGATTTFTYFNGTGTFGLLAPSISFMSVQEELGEQLYINGIFGSDPGADGRVMVGGTPLIVTSWLPTEIHCDLPRDGGGSEGPVTVEVSGDYGGLSPLVYRKSNVVNLTSWRIPFHYEHHEGGANILVDMNLHIRADIHAHREVIHEAPVNLVGVPFHHALDSYGSFAASGSATGCETDGCCITSTWSGGGEMPVPENATGATTFLAIGGIDPAHHTFTMAMGAGSSDGIYSSDCGTCFPPSAPCLDGTLNWQTDISINEGFNPEPYFTMYLNSNFDVIPGERVPSGTPPPFTYTGYFQGTPTIKLSWPAAVAAFPPDSAAGH